MFGGNNMKMRFCFERRVFCKKICMWEWNSKNLVSFQETDSNFFLIKKTKRKRKQMQTKQTSEKEIKRSSALSVCVLRCLSTQRERLCHDLISHQMSREIWFLWLISRRGRKYHIYPRNTWFFATYVQTKLTNQKAMQQRCTLGFIYTVHRTPSYIFLNY